MYSIKRAGKLVMPYLGLVAMLLMASCSADDDSVDPDPTGETEKPFVLSMAIQGSENTFTYYTVPFEDVMTGSLSAAGQGIEQPGYFQFKQIDNTLYSIGGLDNTNVVGINKGENGELIETGDVSYDRSILDIIKADNSTLVAVSMSGDSDVITFHTIDKGGVTATGTTNKPISDLTDVNPEVTDVDVPAYSGMRIVGDQLFLSYYINNPNTWETNYTDEAMVAVYSYPGFEFKEVITDDRVGPIGGFNNMSGLIKDEAGNIYAVSHSNPANGFSQFTNDSGILRINSGETSFDQNYYFDVEEVAGGTPVHLKYLGNGKAFAEINMAPRANQEAWSDNPLQSAIIDLTEKTVDFISNLPQHSGPGGRLAALHDGEFVYLTIPGQSEVSVYRVNLNDYTATKGADVEANFVAGFSKL